jgi:hypothetical protein
MKTLEAIIRFVSVSRGRIQHRPSPAHYQIPSSPSGDNGSRNRGIKRISDVKGSVARYSGIPSDRNIRARDGAESDNRRAVVPIPRGNRDQRNDFVLLVENRPAELAAAEPCCDVGAVVCRYRCRIRNDDQIDRGIGKKITCLSPSQRLFRVEYRPVPVRALTTWDRDVVPENLLGPSYFIPEVNESLPPAGRHRLQVDCKADLAWPKIEPLLDFPSAITKLVSDYVVIRYRRPAKL